MPEHEHHELSESLPESLTVRVGSAPRAGPLPGVVRGRLSARRRARRARLAGGAAGIVGAAALAVALVVRFGPPTASQTEPAPPNDLLVQLDPAAAPGEPLRFDDPMFAALDRSADSGPVGDRWMIGSHLRGEWPSGL